MYDCGTVQVTQLQGWPHRRALTYCVVPAGCAPRPEEKLYCIL